MEDIVNRVFNIGDLVPLNNIASLEEVGWGRIVSLLHGTEEHLLHIGEPQEEVLNTTARTTRFADLIKGRKNDLILLKFARG